MVAVHTSLRMQGGRIRNLPAPLEATEAARRQDLGTGSGEPVEGAPGKSAYQSWLDVGYTGTEADFVAWLKGPAGDGGTGGGSSLARTTAVAGPGISEIGLGRTSLMLRLDSSAPCRIRVYTTRALLNADASRAAGTLPPQGSGCLLEFITVSALLGAWLAPAVTITAPNAAEAPNVHLLIEPTDPNGVYCEVTFTFLKLELT